MGKVEFGIGFITGRKNVCDIINHYYEKIQKQIEGKANLTFFILYDLQYNHLEKEDFCKIDKKIYEKGIKIQYIGTEEIELEKQILQDNYHFSKVETNLLLGHGYGKARNTIMYFALKNKIDYLMFWDDDEYPVACFQDGNQKLIWEEQNNVEEHLENIQNANITIGYRCGYDAPIPYIEYNEAVKEKDFKNFIDGISNEVIHWETIQDRIQREGITYAEQKKIEEGAIMTCEWIYGSGTCINLKEIEKIPAYYNPPQARGEDTFFSVQLKDAKICKVPTYHFHDGFLKCKGIMKQDYPQKLNKVKMQEKEIERRFFNASMGWIKYKPLFLYITQREKYEVSIKKAMKKLEQSIPKMNQLFIDNNFEDLLYELEKYHQNVELHYKEFLQTNEIWNCVKMLLKNEDVRKVEATCIR